MSFAPSLIGLRSSTSARTVGSTRKVKGADVLFNTPISPLRTKSGGLGRSNWCPACEEEDGPVKILPGSHTKDG